MPGKNRQSDPIESHMVFRYIGDGGFINGLPARDLYPKDLIKAERKEHITRAMVEASGMYEPTEYFEIHPFCGAALERGRCRKRVKAWGQKCPAHSEEATT